MPDILLATLNSRYIHASFGLRSLLANLGPLASRAALREFEIQQRTVDILEVILADHPKILGLGCYIWNIDQSTRLVAELKRLAPDMLIVLGGPEVSYEYESLEIVQRADYLVTGEADLAFRELCERLLAGDRPAEKVIPAGIPDPAALAFPYALYSRHDLAHRVVYVEASRGCPYECEFCLSALDIPVRQFPLEPFIAEMQSLLDRGCRQFKFVDRTFNLNPRVSRRILEFFLDSGLVRPDRSELFLHFEMVPDRLPEPLRELIVRFPPGALQFEVGIQTFDPAVSERISRRQDVAKVEANLRWLRSETGVHIHADLIVGLPGETLGTFGAGFDRLVALGPQEIQVGLLKRLRGTPIARHEASFGLVYSPAAPYEILQTSTLDFQTLQRLRRFSRFWDLVANSGQFLESTPLLWTTRSPFAAFLTLSDWLFAETGQTSGIALPRLLELLFRYLTEQAGIPPAVVAETLWRDYQRGGHSDRPACLRPWIGSRNSPAPEPVSPSAQASLPARQSRHRG
jgi:radical SAM superfamily enzyme YgiQ (UPF0313 family)